MGADVPGALIREEILARVAAPGAGKTICPSEVARALAPEHWRGLMQPVRDEAATLAAEGAIAVTQKGASVNAHAARGPIRLGPPPGT